MSPSDKGRFEILLESVERNTRFIAEGHGVLVDRMDAIESKIDKIDGRLVNLEVKFVHLEGQFEQLDAKVEQLDTKIDGVEQRLTSELRALRQTVEGHEQRFQAL